MKLWTRLDGDQSKPTGWTDRLPRQEVPEKPIDRTIGYIYMDGNKKPVVLRLEEVFAPDWVFIPRE